MPLRGYPGIEIQGLMPVLERNLPLRGYAQDKWLSPTESMESDAAANSVVAGNTTVLPDPVCENVSIFRRLGQASFVGQTTNQ